MLRKGNKVTIVITLMWIIFSCDQKSSISYRDNILKEYQNQKFIKYGAIYGACSDSLDKWTKDSLQAAQTIFFYEWSLDSTFIFNSDSNRFFTTVNVSSGRMKSGRSDDVMEFGGARINEKWYFFFISNTMAVPREYYKDDIYEPFTFEELSALSHKEIIKRYVVEKEDGSFIPNEKAFKKLFIDDWYCGQRPCKNSAAIDSIILLYNGQKYKYKLNPKEIIESKEEMANSVRPELPKKKWWQF